MQQKSTTINAQGQIVIPKAFRDYLNSKTVLIRKEKDNAIKLIPIPDLGGSLAKYGAKNVDFKQARDNAWNKEVLSKFNSEK